MADNDQAQTPAPGGIPPKQVPFKPLAAPTPPVPAVGPGPGAPALARRPVLRRPGEAPVVVPPAPGAAAGPVATGIPITPGQAAKKQTSRIDLPPGDLRTKTAPIGDIKTAKVKPISPPTPGSDPLPDGPKPLSEAQVQATKSKTSRISLEAALGAVSEMPAAAAAPKTIRLKRPIDMHAGSTSTKLPGMTAHIGGAASTATAPIPTTPRPATGNLTARLPTTRLATQHIEDGVVGGGEGASFAHPKKTIKVKRPSAPATFKSPRAEHTGDTADLGASGETAELPELALPPGMQRIAPASGADKVHWVFLLTAAAAILVAVLLNLVLASQTFGPNAAVTGYSSPAGPDLPSPFGG
ncbi:MAG: hypothetical protein PHR35_07120 [Kiritimatiellae bacterium]|nr:hypothetical protein [Kiritimatiellia bacterium]